MSIRKANRSDAKQIRDLVYSLSHFYLSDRRSTLPEWLAMSLELTEFEARLESHEFTNIVCELENGIVGYIAMKDNRYLYHLFVAEDYQGKGIARQLWMEITKICRSPQYTVRSSIYAIPIHQKFGFIASGAIAQKDGVQY
jgi:GNAT superfamily N-acetyltransferase